MHRRKIQLIAGTTYSISLPKEWVKENKLKEQSEIVISEKNDRTLIISPHSIAENKLNEISMNVDEYLHNIDQVLFAVYYLGIETINLFSKNEIAKDTKKMIRKTLTYMSGTEISYEDKQKITIKVLLDKSKVDIINILYRVNLLVESSINNILSGPDMEEAKINESEIDRLYHLMTKIVSLSLINSNILSSSKIRNVSLIPSYFLIAKKLENIGDNINYLAEYLKKNKPRFSEEKTVLEFIKSELNRSVRHIMKDFPNVYEKTHEQEIKKMKNIVAEIKEDAIQDNLRELVRYLIDIEEEIVNISFYTKLIRGGVL